METSNNTMEAIVTKNELYTATKTVYEMILFDTLHQIVNDEEVSDEETEQEEGTDILSDLDT